MRDSGFSLLEIVIGLGIAAMVMLTAGGFLASSLDLTERLEIEVRESSSYFHAWIWMEQAFANASTGAEPEQGFQGGPTGADFSTRLWVPGGWLEEVHTTIALDDGRVVIDLPENRSLVLADSVRFFEIDYLARRGSNAPWLTAWDSELLLPPAVRIRAAFEGERVDTAVFVVGGE